MAILKFVKVHYFQKNQQNTTMSDGTLGTCCDILIALVWHCWKETVRTPTVTTLYRIFPFAETNSSIRTNDRNQKN